MPEQSNTRRTEDKPHNRLTRLCADMTETLEANPEYTDDVRCIIFLKDSERGGMVLHGYDDDSQAIVDVIVHLQAIFEVNGKHLEIITIPNFLESL